MIDDLRLVTYGRPASEALSAVVCAAKAGRPLAPVTVVVPSNFAGLTARRLLGGGLLGGHGIANVSFLTPFRLAELLASDLGVDRRPLTNPVLGAAVRRVLAESPGLFAAVADHQATEAAVAELYSELSHVSERSVAAIRRAGGLAAEAVRLFHAIDARLSVFQGEDQVAHCAARRQDLDRVLAPFGTLVWYLPEPMTPALVAVMGAVLDIARSAVIVGLTGADDADEQVRLTCGRAGVIFPARRSLFDQAPDPPVASEIVSVTDSDEEVRAVVRRIAAFAEEGVRLDRIGIFYPAPDPYLRTIQQQLAAAGIPANGPSRERLLDSVAGRTLLCALALPAQRWRRDRVMALVSGGPVRDGDRGTFPTTWEELSRAAGVVGGLDDWRTKLRSLRTVLDGRLARTAREDSDRAAQLLRELENVGALDAFVFDLAKAVLAVGSARGWATKTQAASALLRQLLGDEARRQHWPEREQDAAQRVEDALVRLSALDEIEPEPTPEVFRRALTSELDVPRGRTGRFGEGVVYGPLVSSAGYDLDAVFVLGMTEGQCPSTRRDDALLPDAARAQAVDDELGTRTTRMLDQHRAFLSALATAPPDRRVLVYPRGDLRGGRHPLPSRWLLDTATALAGRTVYSTGFPELGPPVVDVVASYAAGVRDAPSPASSLERDLGQVLAHVEGGGEAANHPATADIRRGLDSGRARRSADFTEWDGNLEGLAVPSPASGSLLSATGLESWAACGFRYFLSHVLGLRDRDDPARVIELSALDRGSAVHAVLEEFFGEVIARGSPAPDVGWTAEDRARARAIAESVFDRYERAGRTGRDVHWQIERLNLLALIDEFLTADDVFRSRHKARPVRVELPFGLDGAPPVTVALLDGRPVAFRGRADRVDVTEEGAYIVNDYKTGKGEAYKQLEAGDPVQAGTTLQLGLYAEAVLQLLGAQTASATYWMVNEDAGFAQYGYPWDGERRDRFGSVIDGIVAGIDAGVFAAVPGDWDSWRHTNTNCRYCDFDGVCPRDRGESAQVKLGAPQLRAREILGGPEEDHA